MSTKAITDESTNDQPTINQRSTTIKQEEQEQQRKQEEQREGASAPTPTETMKDFVLSVSEKNERYQNLIQKISERWQIPAEKVSAEFDKFTNYWCERTRDGKRERWQTEKVFEVQRRLVTWFQNVQKFSGLNGRSEKKGIRIIS